MKEQKPKHRGGKRDGAGRKPLADLKKTRHTLTLDTDTVTAVRKRTDNLSGLIDSLLKDWLKKPVD